MENRIYYGFGDDYLKNWGIKEALREVYQNFLDYGKYEETIDKGDGTSQFVHVTVANEWIPESLDFLRIGNSKKNNPNAVGKHGEGLKMAFMIFLRIGISSKIRTPKYDIVPNYYTDAEIGNCFCFEYKEHNEENVKYSISFACIDEQFDEFRKNLIIEKDLIFTDAQYGSIVDKEPGNIYAGGLFVTKLKNIGKAYNVKPSELPLDRDRSVPRAFDVNWTTSKINSAYGKWTAEDLSHSDTLYVDKVPDEVKKAFKPVYVNKQIEFVTKDEKGKNIILSNDNIKEIFKKDTFFAGMIKKMKKYIAKKLGLYDMLLEFKEKHVHSTEAVTDFDLILEKVFKEEKQSEKEKEPITEPF